MNLPDYLSPSPEDLIDPWAHELTVFETPLSDDYTIRCSCDWSKTVSRDDLRITHVVGAYIMNDALYEHVSALYAKARIDAKWGPVPRPIQL